MVQKLIRDGKVAVLISGGFGAGWFTWNSEYPEMLFDPEIAKMLEDKEPKSAIEKVAAKKYPKAFLGGLRDLDIQWIPVGTLFKVDEYDGSESIESRDSTDWMVA